MIFGAVRRLLPPLILVALAVIYGSTINDPTLLKRDDLFYLDPLWSIASISDFFHYLRSPAAMDFQPIRDLSWLLDIFLERETGVRFFRAHNLVLWLGCCFLFWKWIGEIVEDSDASLYLVSLFSVHPLYLNSVAWISARKHLLAFLFFLGLMWVFEKRRRGRGGVLADTAIVVLYLLSVFSQPILVFLPVWLALVTTLDLGGFRGRRFFSRENYSRLTTLLVLTILMVGVVVVQRNHYYAYYRTALEPAIKVATMDWMSLSPPGEALLALGRYFFQVAVPLRYAVVYDEHSLLNMLGLGLGALFFGLLGARKGGRNALEFGALFLICLILPVLKIRTLFVSDTYLLGASVAFWAGLGKMTSRRLVRHRFFPLFILLGFGVLAFKSAQLIPAWRSDSAMWSHAYKVEPSCYGSMLHAMHELKAGKKESFLTVSDYHFSRKCSGDISASLFLLALYHHNDLPVGDRVGALEKIPGIPTPLHGAILAALQLKKQDSPAAAQTLKTTIEKFPDFWHRLHRIEMDPLRAELDIFCKTARFLYCGLAKAPHHPLE